MITDQTIRIQPSDIELKLGNLNCDSSNVVYILKCAKCPDVNYIGQTENRFRIRFNNHKSSIRLNRPGYPVETHFNLRNLSLKDFMIAIICGPIINYDARIYREAQLFTKLGCYKDNGLNRDRAFLSGLAFYK